MGSLSGADIFDIFFGILFLYFGIKGFLRGLTGELCSLIGIIGGVFLAWKLGPLLASQVTHTMPSDKMQMITIGMMVLIFVVVNLASALIYRIIRLFVTFTALRTVDRVAGIVSGGLKGMAVLLLVFVLGSMLQVPLTQSWFVHSRSMKYAAIIWPHVSGYVNSRGLQLHPHGTPQGNRPAEGSFSVTMPHKKEKSSDSF